MLCGNLKEKLTLINVFHYYSHPSKGQLGRRNFQRQKKINLRQKRRKEKQLKRVSFQYSPLHFFIVD